MTKKTKKKVTKKAPVKILEIKIPKPKPKPLYAFSIEHEGQALYGVNMFEIVDGVITETTKINSGQFAKSAVMLMGKAAMQIQLNGMKPERLKTREIMPSVNGQR